MGGRQFVTPCNVFQLNNCARSVVDDLYFCQAKYIVIALETGDKEKRFYVFYSFDEASHYKSVFKTAQQLSENY